jgi:hypothetical protein
MLHNGGASGVAVSTEQQRIENAVLQDAQSRLSKDTKAIYFNRISGN